MSWLCLAGVERLKAFSQLGFDEIHVRDDSGPGSLGRTKLPAMTHLD
jgi:hypothetical protein